MVAADLARAGGRSSAGVDGGGGARRGTARGGPRRGWPSCRASERISYIDVPRLDISSSALRRRVRDGRPIDYLVPDAVGDYIEQEGLYR